MNWNSVGEFIAMGGYGLYVWGSVLMTLVLLAAEVGTLKARRKALIKQYARRLRGARKDGK